MTSCQNEEGKYIFVVVGHDTAGFEHDWGTVGAVFVKLKVGCVFCNLAMKSVSEGVMNHHRSHLNHVQYYYNNKDHALLFVL